MNILTHTRNQTKLNHTNIITNIDEFIKEVESREYDLDKEEMEDLLDELINNEKIFAHFI